MYFLFFFTQGQRNTSRELLVLFCDFESTDKIGGKMGMRSLLVSSQRLSLSHLSSLVRLSNPEYPTRTSSAVQPHSAVLVNYPNSVDWKLRVISSLTCGVHKPTMILQVIVQLVRLMAKHGSMRGFIVYTTDSTASPSTVIR